MTDKIQKDQMMPLYRSGDDVTIIHKSGDNFRVITVTCVKDGQPLLPGEDLFKVERSATTPGVYDMETVYKSPYQGQGPAKVASTEYRSGWDDVFGTPDKGMLN